MGQAAGNVAGVVEIRVIGGEEDPVGVFAAHLAHALDPLGGAASGDAGDHGDGRAGIVPLQVRQQGLGAGPVVHAVHQHVDAAALVPVHAARNHQAVQGRGHLLMFRPQQTPHADGGQGVFSGYIGGKFDMLLMRFTDIFLALPSMLLMVVMNALLQPGLTTLIVVLSLFSWASVARITRAETMSIKERDYVSAVKNLGAGSVRIAVKHIVPNILGPVIVAASLGVANAILMESSLSFLGLGVQIPVASWGSRLQGAQSHILDTPRLAVFPGLLILITVLSFNLLGDVLRTALEPKIVE